MTTTLVLCLLVTASCDRLLIPNKGTIVVLVEGPGHTAISTPEIWVDGTKVCEKSPCRTPELDVGNHRVKVVAAGYLPTPDQVVEVRRAEEAVHIVVLQPKT